MFLARLGSLNALEQTRESKFWSKWIAGDSPSADSMGRICALVNHDDLRAANHHIYSRLKRNKALVAPWHGLTALVLDGHESHSTYRRRCDGCLQRDVTVKNKSGDTETRKQFYHRHVTAQLLTKNFPLMLDAEPIRSGEDELAAAMRLLERVLASYPRAFEVVIADALYTDPRFFKFVRERGKHVLAVLKNENRDLIRDVRSLCEVTAPVEIISGKRNCQCWDMAGLESWPQVGMPVRVVRSEERWSVQRQLDGELEEQVSEWLWVTSLPESLAGTAAIRDIGHSRWTIENEGFNELVTRWHGDHVYKHDDSAMLSFWLVCLIACNVFQAFFLLNLKPQAREKYSMLHLARLISSCLYAEIPSRSPG